MTPSSTWQDFLVSRMLGARSEQNKEMWRNKFWKFWRQWSGFVVGAFLILVGTLILILWQQNIVRDFGTAFLISGVLTVTVDPYLKGKAQREAALDIFQHMLGFRLPDKIQDRLKHIVETTEWYRANSVIHCVASESGENVFFDIEQEFEIVNATQHTLAFRPIMEFERTEYPLLRRVICFDVTEYGKDAALKPDPNEPKALAYYGEPLNIEPTGKRRFKYEYRVQYPVASGVFAVHFKYPTIGLSLTVKSADSLKITASRAEFECPGEWRYADKLFMPGDHTEIRWERIEPTTSN
jgi:hypothetical protein